MSAARDADPRCAHCGQHVMSGRIDRQNRHAHLVCQVTAERRAERDGRVTGDELAELPRPAQPGPGPARAPPGATTVTSGSTAPSTAFVTPRPTTSRTPAGVPSGCAGRAPRSDRAATGTTAWSRATAAGVVAGRHDVTKPQAERASGGIRQILFRSQAARPISRLVSA